MRPRTSLNQEAAGSPRPSAESSSRRDDEPGRERMARDFAAPALVGAPPSFLKEDTVLTPGSMRWCGEAARKALTKRSARRSRSVGRRRVGAGRIECSGCRNQGDPVSGDHRDDQRCRRLWCHRDRSTRRGGRPSGRQVHQRRSGWLRGPQGHALHLREPVDPGGRADLRQRHGPKGGRGRRRAVHRARPDRGADHHRGRDSLHHRHRRLHG